MTKFRVKFLELVAKADAVNGLYEFLDVTINYSVQKGFDYVSLRIQQNGELIYYKNSSDVSLEEVDRMIDKLDEILLDAKEVI